MVCTHACYIFSPEGVTDGCSVTPQNTQCLVRSAGQGRTAHWSTMQWSVYLLPALSSFRFTISPVAFGWRHCGTLTRNGGFSHKVNVAGVSTYRRSAQLTHSVSVIASSQLMVFVLRATHATNEYTVWAESGVVECYRWWYIQYPLGFKGLWGCLYLRWRSQDGQNYIKRAS
jgi:hypothetical protein